MRTLLLATLLALPMTPALADSKVTFGNGATIERTRDCVRSDGQATCTVDSLRTGVEGQISTKTRVRTLEPGQSVVDISVTGPGGETRTRTRKVIWGN